MTALGFLYPGHYAEDDYPGSSSFWQRHPG